MSERPFVRHDVLYAIDKDLCGRNVLQSVAIDRLILLRICSSR